MSATTVTRSLRHLTPASLGRWSTSHPWRAIACWLVFVVLAVGALGVSGSKGLQSGTTGESARAERMLKDHQIRPGQSEYAYLHSPALQVGSPAFRGAIAKVEASMQDVLGNGVTAKVSKDGRSALVSGPIGRPFSVDALAASVAAAGRPTISAVLDDNDTSSRGNKDLQRAERLSVPVTLFVLLIAFGALVASIVPVLLGATAVLASFGLLGPISQVFPLDSSVKTVVLLIGMAVGVDYALFYVIRSCEERNRGLSADAALERTARTSGHTVIVAGTTVMIAMAGQFLMRSDIFNGIASGTIAVIACAVAGSVTVLPALLELLGPRIDRGHIPFLPHLAAGGDSRFWPAVVDRVLRRPIVSALVAFALLAALAVPAAGMHVSDPGDNVLSPRLSQSLQQQITTDFPGTAAPAIVVFSWPSGAKAAAEGAAGKLEALAKERGIAHPPFMAGTGRDGRAAAVKLPLSGLPDSATAKAALATLRSQLIPQTLGRVTGLQVAVTGPTAVDVDTTAHLTAGLPYVIGFVLALAFLILLVTFRSIVIPIKAIALNLLSVGASYGVLVLVFQRHWAESILGFQSMGSIIAWLPVFLFVVLFGLSMDYHVFILNRIREGIDDGMSNDEAVRYGVARTAGVVTSAAIVMVGVFSLFATATALDLKQAGIGLGAAVLLDATLIRGVLLPASMKLLGDWNWYLPRWLEWLPATHGHEAPQPDELTPSTTAPGANAA